MDIGERNLNEPNNDGEETNIDSNKPNSNNKLNENVDVEENIDGNINENEHDDSKVPKEDKDSNYRITPNYVWSNITDEFFESIKELKLGELMHHELFGLYEAMSAIEMMEPKMDAGICYNKKSEVPLTFETAVECGQLKLISIEYNELIGIIDGIYSCFVSWLEGHSLAQTVFTCLYMHKPNLIEDRTLKSFCYAVHKLIQIIQKFIINSMIYEDEDFEPGSYGYSLYPDISEGKSLSMLKEAEEELLKKTKTTDHNVDEIQAVTARLKLMRFLLQSLSALWPEKVVTPNDVEMQDIIKSLNACIELIPLIKKTLDKGTQPDIETDFPNPMGFSPLVNHKLLSTFPRNKKITDRLSSITFIEELIHRLKLACKVIHCQNYHSALNFFLEFSKKSGPCVLSRSVLQSLFLPNHNKIYTSFNHNKVFGTIEFTDFLKESAKIFIAPPVLIPKNHLYSNQQAKRCVDAFFYYSKNMQTFAMFLKICGYNRARQRDKLARLLDDFGNLQDEAERVDSYLYSLTMKNDTPRHNLALFGTWVLYNCLRAMSLYLLSGLELELYSLHEYLYIFWYLYEFLFGWVVSTLTRADSFLIEQDCLADQQKQTTSKQRKIKLKKRKVKPYYKEIMYNQAMQNMCGGYYKGLAGFTKDNRIPQPLSVFDNEKVRFDHRFAPFSSLNTPPPLQYIEFKKMRSRLLKSPSAELYLGAAKHFHQARSILEAIPNPEAEINDILRVAKVNFVVMNLLANGHKKDSTVIPEFDYSIHHYFPIIKIQ